jgi:hypothetical protein
MNILLFVSYYRPIQAFSAKIIEDAGIVSLPNKGKPGVEAPGLIQALLPSRSNMN